jgi:hypothetical protein
MTCVRCSRAVLWSTKETLGKVAEADALRPTLLIIDMLVDFLDRWPAADRAALVAAIRALADGFHAANYPIVWVRQEFAPDLSDAFREMQRDNIRVAIKDYTCLSRGFRSADLVQCRSLTLGEPNSVKFDGRSGEQTAVDAQMVRHRRRHAPIRYLCRYAGRKPAWRRCRERDPASDTRGQ